MVVSSNMIAQLASQQGQSAVLPVIGTGAVGEPQLWVNQPRTPQRRQLPWADPSPAVIVLVANPASFGLVLNAAAAETIQLDVTAEE